jgi:diguanylate cyclase (GGDEF)-like protein
MQTNVAAVAYRRRNVGKLTGVDGRLMDAEPHLARRVRAVRVNSLRALLGPGLAAGYLLATVDRPYRVEMLLIAAVMLIVHGVTGLVAPLIARSRPVRLVAPGAGVVVTVAGSGALSLLDGGLHSPLGAMLPFSLVFFAIMVPPRLFLLASVLSGVAYGVVAVAGKPAPPGYAVVYVLGIGGVAFLCFRHASGLRSLRHRLADASRTDPLTRSLNRRGFDERLAQAIADADRTGHPVTLILADLDRFKAVNDTYGHQAGDDVLAWTARTLAGALRPADVLGRLGGDEFGAVLAGSGTARARATVGRLREALRDTVPVSFGHAVYPAEAATADDLRRLADERAYADKLARRGPVPPEPDIARVRAEADRPVPREVARTERRRRSIVDTGLLCASDSAVGVVWAVGFGAASPHRLAIGLLMGLGTLYGLGMARAADRLSRLRRIRAAFVACLVFPLLMAIVVPWLGGGVDSSLGLGVLAPMPLIALLAPPRVAVPVIGVITTAYVTMALTVGHPDTWYWVMHLAGTLAATGACYLQGRTAARQRVLLTRLSQTDPLTGCLNRRGFAEKFAAATAASPVSLIVFDLDGFKQLNDTAGHAAGDDLLRWVAGTLRSAGQVTARLGGDEFVVLCPYAAGHARMLAEQLRYALSARTAASVGVAGPGGGFTELYAAADAELYREKSARRPLPATG